VTKRGVGRDIKKNGSVIVNRSTFSVTEKKNQRRSSKKKRSFPPKASHFATWSFSRGIKRGGREGRNDSELDITGEENQINGTSSKKIA